MLLELQDDDHLYLVMEYLAGGDVMVSVMPSHACAQLVHSAMVPFSHEACIGDKAFVADQLRLT